MNPSFPISARIWECQHLAPFASYSIRDGSIWHAATEQHGATLTLWLARSLAWHQCEDAMVKALTLTAAQKSGALPLRAGWLGENQLVLFVSLDERSLTLPLLHQAFEQLLRLQQEVLAP